MGHKPITKTNYFYLHRDYQGSILAITNATGAVVEKRLFDAWGAILKAQDGASNNLTKLTFFDRGYIGHEHLESVGLIHMNARLYDPKLHRFLQADNYIQDINNTQNYNRYGYCFNNPLKYTDPSGNFIQLGVAVIIAVGVALTTHIIQVSKNHQHLTFGGVMTTVSIAAFSSYATFGIGEMVSTMGNFYLQAGVQAVAHGTLQGGLTAMQGGKFWSGFAAGSISSIVSSGWAGDANHQGASGAFGFKGNNGITTGGTLFFGTISGGAGAALTGGNFWQGAVTGLIVSGLNHTAHAAFDGGGDPKKKGVMQKIKENPDKILEASEFGIALKKASMLNSRGGLSLNKKIGTFGNFSSKYKPYSKIGGALGKVNSAVTIYNTSSDIYDYNKGNLSGARLSYRLGGTAATILTSSVIGGQFGGTFGVLGGFVVGIGFTAGEMIYDGWNNTIMPCVNQATYQINNNHGWTNFHR